jgi:hypothetical protein
MVVGAGRPRNVAGGTLPDRRRQRRLGASGKPTRTGTGSDGRGPSRESIGPSFPAAEGGFPHFRPIPPPVGDKYRVFRTFLRRAHQGLAITAPLGGRRRRSQPTCPASTGG